MEDKEEKVVKKEKIRITFVGPGFVGKTALINKITNNYFVRYHYPTSNFIQYEFKYKVGDDEDNLVRYQLAERTCGH
jgi:GTPase SAR1 family protein